MKHFISAIQFLTILPTPATREFDPGRMIPFFPMVGLLLGALVCLFDLVACRLWTTPVISVLDVVLLAVFTGALHLDGLGDAADGLLGHRPREKALEIMKDSRVGAMGLVAVVCGLAIKWAGLSGIESNRWLFLIIVPALARGGTLFGMRMMDYGRPGGGTGHAFFENKLGVADFWGLSIPIGLAFLSGWRGMLVIVVFFAVIAILISWYKRRMGCITGDMIGAMVEVTESMLFLTASLGGGP